MNEFLIQLGNFFQSMQGTITVIFVIVGSIWQYWRFVKEWNFKNYHQLIKELNQSDTPNEPIKLYRQVAVVYELRNYPRYFSVSKRILQGWIDSRSEKSKEFFDSLYKEMQLSIEFMNKNFLQRCWSKICKK